MTYHYQCPSCGYELERTDPAGDPLLFCSPCNILRQFKRVYSFGIGRGTSGKTPPR